MLGNRPARRASVAGLLRTLAALALPALVATAAAAAPAEGTFPIGRLVEDVACLADPTQTYTLYLPPGYTPEEPRPALFIFDPRGRSKAAAEIFLAGAETYGWILLSSNDTRSDGPWEPNVRAVQALVPELGGRWAVDPKRVYAAGFSGGAHVAWLLGLQSVQDGGGLAGVLASGGRVGPAWMVDEVPFASFGAAGTTDFNYQGMHRVDAHFAAAGAPHRLEIFEGPHRWMDAAVAFEGMGWLEVVAMKQGRRPLDPALAAARLAADLEGARELEADGELLRAAARYESVLSTYGDLGAVLGDEAWRSSVPGPAQVDAARRDLDALRQRRDYRQAVKERRRWDAYESAYDGKLGSVLARLHDVDEPMPAGRVMRELEIERLQRRAADETASRDARRTAQRLLETAGTQTGFYLAREFLGSGQYARAAVVLEVATAIHPQRAHLWYNLACARSRNGQRASAVEALDRAVGAGYRNLAHLQSDADLDALRELPAYAAVVDRLRSASGDGPAAATEPAAADGADEAEPVTPPAASTAPRDRPPPAAR
jgi:dienelactone hydrolase